MLNLSDAVAKLSTSPPIRITFQVSFVVAASGGALLAEMACCARFRQPSATLM